MRHLTAVFCVLLPALTRAEEPRASLQSSDSTLSESDFTIDGLPQQHYRLDAAIKHGTLKRINQAGSVGYVIVPRDTVDRERRWVWIVPLWLALPSQYGNQTARFYVEELLKRGFHVAGFDVGVSLGSPRGAQLFAEFHSHIVQEFRLAQTARMLAVSNGGLITYGYAFRHPDRIDSILGVYPALDFTSWPGLHLVVGERAFAPEGVSFGLEPAEMNRRISEFNPIHNLQPLAAAGIPILHLHGDADELVPLHPNTLIAAERYRALGGTMKVRVLPMQGHGGKQFFTDGEALQFLLTATRSRPRPPSSTPHLDQAVDLIRQQVNWFGASADLSREFLAALATMNFVQARVSPLNYAVRVKEGLQLPGTPEEYLAMESGICGGQVMTFRAILDRLGVRNRPVEFYFRGATRNENHSHIGAEVYYADDWHFFDITWGTCYRQGKRPDAVLSIQDLLGSQSPRKFAITNQSDLWFQQWTSKGLDPLEYLSHQEMDVIVGRAGSVRLQPSGGGERPQVFVPTHQPGYVGRNHASSDFGSITFRLTGVDPTRTQCCISVVGVAGSGDLVVRGSQREARRSLSELTPGDHLFDSSNISTDGELEVLVESSEELEIGYVVINRITID